MADEYDVGQHQLDFLDEWYDKNYDKQTKRSIKNKATNIPEDVQSRLNGAPDDEEFLVLWKEVKRAKYKKAWKTKRVTTSKIGKPPRVAVNLTNKVREELPENVSLEFWWNSFKTSETFWRGEGAMKGPTPAVKMFGEKKRVKWGDWEDDKRIRVEYPKELRQKKNIKPGQTREIEIPIFKKVEEKGKEPEDIIPISKLSFEEYVTGEYENRDTGEKRRIDIKGDVICTLGVLAPKQVRDAGNESDFWDRLFGRIRNFVFTGNEPTTTTTDANGKWWNEFLDIVRKRAANADAADKEIRGLANKEPGPDWDWHFNESKSDLGEGDDLENKMRQEAVEEGIT